MKLSFLFFVFFFVQFTFAQTSLEEYKYITKGYKIQIDSGLDMKKGYTLKDLEKFEFPYENTETGEEFYRSIDFKALYRQEKICAIMVIYHNTSTELTYYFCIPHFKSEDKIWELTIKDFNREFAATNSGEAFGVCIVGLMYLNKVEGPTTLEEYNYLSKGYEIQIDSGLDMKKGYSLKDLCQDSLLYEDGERSVEFKSLVREKSNTECAILGIYKNSNDEEQTHYFCIPSLNADQKIWKNALESFSFFESIESLETLNYGLMRLISPKD